MTNWLEFFQKAGRSAAIQNVKPKGDGARNIYDDDEKEIQRVAAKCGYVQYNTKGSIIKFINTSKT